MTSSSMGIGPFHCRNRSHNAKGIAVFRSLYCARKVPEAANCRRSRRMEDQWDKSRAEKRDVTRRIGCRFRNGVRRREEVGAHNSFPCPAETPSCPGIMDRAIVVLCTIRFVGSTPRLATMWTETAWADGPGSCVVPALAAGQRRSSSRGTQL